MCSIGVLNGMLCAQLVWSTGIYDLLNWTLLGCSTGVLNRNILFAQLDIIGVLNWCAQQEFIMCSTGHYWGAQWEVMCSTGQYWCTQLEIIGVLNGKLLCAQLEIIGVLNGKLMVCIW